MRLRLGTKLTVMVIVMFAVLSSLAIFWSYRGHSNTMDQYYKTMATNVARTAASQLDPDKLTAYRKTLQKDGDYQAYLDMLFAVKESNDCAYLYVQYSADDIVTFLFDADNGPTAKALGDTVPNEMGDGMDLARYTYGDTLPAFISNGVFGWLCTGMVVVKDASGGNVALVGADIDMTQVMAERHAFLRSILLVELGVAVLLAAFLLLAVNKNVVGPVNRLSEATAHFLENRTEKAFSLADLNIHTGDEIERLGASIQTMEGNINEYIKNLTAVTAEKERIGAELDVASAIQDSMLPKIFPAFPQYDKFEIFATMDPAKEVGGDFYDFFFLDETRLAIVIADVSGKGVPAALVMVITKALIKDRFLSGAAPADALTAVNTQLCESNDEGMFITCWAAIIDIDTGKMQYVNAGHNAPVLLHAGGEAEWLNHRSGFVLAGMQGVSYRPYEARLAPGDLLYLYTDGVTEATDTENRLFGEERLMASLKSHSALAPSRLLPAVTADVAAFVGDAPQFDDITMLALRLLHTFEVKTFPADVAHLDDAIDYINNRLIKEGCSPKALSQIDIALDELLTNVVTYSGSPDMTVGCRINGPSARILLSDRGTPFNPFDLPAPDTKQSAEERQIGGLGVFLVTKLMDRAEYAYYDNRNTVMLEKQARD